MVTPGHLTCLLENQYVGQEATVRTGYGTSDWDDSDCHPLYLTSMQSTSSGCMSQDCRENISNVRYGGGHGNPLQYSCLGNPVDKGAWRATVHGVLKSQDTAEWLSIAQHCNPDNRWVNGGSRYMGFPGSSAGKEYACDAGDLCLIPGSGWFHGEGIGYPLQYSWASLVGQMVKNVPAMQETWIRSLGWEDPLEEGKATHSSILAWRILMDRGAWKAIVQGVAKSQSWLSD